MTHPCTHVLALLLSPSADRQDDYEVVAGAIEALFSDYPDERKADLYALIADTVKMDMTFEARVAACNVALTSNEARWCHG